MAEEEPRYLGVAAFGYALLHTLFYLNDKAGLDPVLSELPRLYIWDWLGRLPDLRFRWPSPRTTTSCAGWGHGGSAAALDLCRGGADAGALGGP